MDQSTRPQAFWVAWFTVVVIGTMIFGWVMVLAPTLTMRSMSLFLYGQEPYMSGFGAEAGRYISLLHAVLGAMLCGWAVALLRVVRRPFARGSKEAWDMLVASLVAWFIPDTGFSIWSGFWPNAALDVVFALLFAIPLTATYRSFHGAGR